MKRLVSSQETYIKELEEKVQELESAPSVEEKQSEKTASEWEHEKQQLLTLVKKNQQIARDLELKIRQKEEEIQGHLNQKTEESAVQERYLQSENRILKELQEKKITSEKERQNFHITLRNMLLEEIERIEREQREKEAQMEKWRVNFESDTGKEID